MGEERSLRQSDRSRNDQKRDNLLTALALTELSVHYEQVDSELATKAWQLAAARLVGYDIQSCEVAAELAIGE